MEMTWSYGYSAALTSSPRPIQVPGDYTWLCKYYEKIGTFFIWYYGLIGRAGGRAPNYGRGPVVL